MNDGLKDKHRKAIFDILTANPRVERVVLFGSRAMGTFTTTSDVDLALFGDELTLTDQARLAAAIDKLPMAQQVDLLLYKSIDNDKLKQHIKKHGKEWFCRGWGMSADWPLVSLAELYDIRSGLSKPAKDFGTGFPFLSFKDVFYNFFVPNKLTELVQTNERERESCSIQKDDVFLTRTSETINELGMSCVALKDYDQATFNGFTKRLRPKSGTNLLPEYVGYYLRSPSFRKDMMAFSTLMSTRASLNNEMISRLKLLVPPRREQEKIAYVLKTLDDKIELNRQINQTLEEMAQAIFKSWFVDFEPVKAKIEAKVSGQDPQRAAMCAISGKTAAELDQLPPDQFAQLRATAALFPDELNDSELGLIPKGWDVSTIGNEFHATMGQSPPGSTYNEVGEGMAFFQGRRDFGWRYPVNRVYCTEPKRIAKIGDTLLSVRAPVGDVNKATSGCCIGRGIAALRHKTGCEAYTYYSVKRLEHYFSNFDTEGTVFGSINQKDLKAIKLICPTDEMLKIFSKIAGKIDSQILNYEKQISTLAQLRDTLLPKLLSGEISVGSAQSTIDEAV